MSNFNEWHWKKIEITAYESVDGICRIEYKGHVIQIYGYDDGNPDLNITHCVINEDGSGELGEFDCLLKAIKCIDGVKK